MFFGEGLVGFGGVVTFVPEGGGEVEFALDFGFDAVFEEVGGPNAGPAGGAGDDEVDVVGVDGEVGDGAVALFGDALDGAAEGDVHDGGKGIGRLPEKGEGAAGGVGLGAFALNEDGGGGGDVGVVFAEVVADLGGELVGVVAHLAEGGLVGAEEDEVVVVENRPVV